MASEKISSKSVEIIKSIDNKTYKSLSKMNQKKYRDREETYLIEGDNLVRDCLCKGVVSLVILAESKYRKESNDIVELSIEKNVKLVVFEDKLFKRISFTENPQGILGIAKKKAYTIEEFFEDENNKIIVLDRVADPGNMGTIIRTARATDHKLIVLKGSVDPYSPKVARSSMGAIADIPIIIMDKYSELIQLLRERKIKIVGAILDGKTTFENLELQYGAAIILGNEADGISEELIKEIDIGVRIPMEDTVESLNVSIAGALLMYKAYIR